MIGRHAERVVDVQDERVAVPETLDSWDAKPRIEALGAELGDVDELRVDVDVTGPRKMEEAALRFELSHGEDALAARALADPAAEKVIDERRNLALVA